MYCLKCGNECSDTWVFCPICGYELPNLTNQPRTNTTNMRPEFKNTSVSMKTPSSGGRRSMLGTLTEKMEKLWTGDFEKPSPPIPTPSKSNSEIKMMDKKEVIKVTELSEMYSQRKSFLYSLTEKLDKLYSVLTYSNTGKEVRVSELGQSFSLLILELTKLMFEHTEMMNYLGIKKTDDSVRELHIFSYYLIMRTIMNSTLELDQKIFLIHCVFDNYIKMVTDYHRDIKKMDENSVSREITKLKKLTNDRLTNYENAFHKLKVGNTPSDLECGKVFINTLKEIIPPKNLKDRLEVIYFEIFFEDGLELTHRMLNIDSYRISDVNIQKEYRELVENKLDVSVDNGRIKIRFH